MKQHERSVKKLNIFQGEFDWSKRLRGIMLSAFFWGYIVTQIPSGWLTSRWGSKMVITVGMLVSNVANVLIPVAARINPYLVVVLRFVTGLGHVSGFLVSSCLMSICFYLCNSWNNAEE